MPIYEYRCGTCEAVFELVRPIGKAPARAKCPHDGGRGRRVFSPVAFVGASESALDSFGGGEPGAGGDDFGGMGDDWDADF